MKDTPKKKRGRPPGKSKKHADLPGEEPGVTLIKKYGNRRLYDTKRSRYVTLEDLVDVIASGEEIRVVDETTGEDTTKRVMTQIILQEEEHRNVSLLPLGLLKKLIQHRDETMRDYFQRYLSMSFDAYMQAQKMMEQRMQGFASAGFDPSAFSTMFPWFGMNPMGGVGAPQQPWTPPSPAAPPPAPPPPPPKPATDDVAAQLAELKRKLEELEGKSRK